MKYKLFISIVTLFLTHSSLNAEGNYCYQKPDKCSAGDILILSISDDIAKYCDLDKQIITIEKRIKKSSFNNEEVICVKIATPRKKLK